MLAAYEGGVQKPHGKTQRYVAMCITSVQAYYLKPKAEHYASQIEDTSACQRHGELVTSSICQVPVPKLDNERVYKSTSAYIISVS